MMRLLLDTHIVLWSFYNKTRVPARAQAMILAAEETFVSAASIWEFSIKVRIGKFDTDVARLLGSLAGSGFTELPVLSRHAVEVAKIPLYHRDPFDRLLVAQAITEDLYLLTVDAKLPQYGSSVVRV